MAHYSGRVHTVVFENIAQAFYVLRVVMDGDTGMPVVVRGNIPGLDIKIGTWIPFEADWLSHPQYGRQLSITKAPSVPKWTAATVASILTTHGITDRVATALRDVLGEDLVAVLDAPDLDRLAAIPVVGSRQTAEFIIDRWQTARAFVQTLGFLTDVGIPRNRVAKVWSTFGAKAREVLSVDPWAMVLIDGISFSQADEVARRLGLPMDSPNRIAGAVLNACRENRGMGHLFLRTGEVYNAILEWCPGATNKDVADAIRTLVQTQPKPRLVVDKVTRPGTVAIYEPWMRDVESISSQLLLERRTTAVDLRIVERLKLSVAGANLPDDASVCANAAIDRWATAGRITLSTAQREGVVNALTQPVSVLTGLPGTGKTTSLIAVVDILKDLGMRVLLIAPTGIAAKRMSSVTGLQAATIHRAFGAKGWGEGRDERSATYVGVTGSSTSASEGSDGSGEQWARTNDPYPADVVIVDESSMVDQHLLYRILTCTPKEARLVFIGDAAQLPSVGPGNVLADLVASAVFPTVALREIYRQKDTSGIVLAAHAINAGEVPEVSDDPGKDFRFMTLRDENAILKKVLEVSKRLHLGGINFQVMSPRHAGTIGVTNLNAKMREELNPKSSGTAEIRIGSEVLREGDRIMVVKNNYDLGVFNGDIGTVARIDTRSGHVEADIFGPTSTRVLFPLKDAPDTLRLAYAVTVHKMQGQESDVIVMPWVPGFYNQLQRNLLYTAITRAKRKAILIGSPESLGVAVTNTRTDVRNTLFLDRLVAGGADITKIA
jgi:exodeoxyribonuclease V alpha subunit